MKDLNQEIDDQEVAAILSAAYSLLFSQSSEIKKETEPNIQSYSWRFSARSWALPQTLQRRRPFHTRFGWR